MMKPWAPLSLAFPAQVSPENSESPKLEPLSLALALSAISTMRTPVNGWQDDWLHENIPVIFN